MRGEKGWDERLGERSDHGFDETNEPRRGRLDVIYNSDRGKWDVEDLMSE